MRGAALLAVAAVVLLGTIGGYVAGRRLFASATRPSPPVPTTVAVDASATLADLRRENADLAAEVQADRRRRLVEDRLDVRIDGAAAHFGCLTGIVHFTGDAVDRRTFNAVLPLVLDELGRYPDRAIRRVGLKRVIVCSNLREFGQQQGGVTVALGGTVYLSVEWYEDGPAAFRHVVDHEMFHLIDYAITSPWDADPEWTAANPPGFRYGPIQADSAALGSSTVPGFVSGYAQTSIREDRADLFGWMMADPAAVARLAAADPGLARKANRLKAVVTTFDATLGDQLPAVPGVRTAGPAPAPSAAART